MSQVSTAEFTLERWLYLFFGVHLISWTLAPILLRYNLPLDAIESTIWGHQLEWGYDKNPYLIGWISALAVYLDHYSGWLLYFFSQVCVVTCLWTTWKLAKYFLPSVYALMSVMILESIQYFNFHAIDFSDNTLELCLWSLTTYFFYRALCDSKKSIPWILTGLFASLGVMAKYYTLVLLMGMMTFLFVLPSNRKQLKTFAPYLGFIIFICIILPHCIWLHSNDYITIQYAFTRTQGLTRWSNHLFNPLQFLWQQSVIFLPALLIFLSLFVGGQTHSFVSTSRFNKLFLFFCGVFPFLFTVFLSVFFGIKLRAGWGAPLLSTWGIILFLTIQPAITRKKLAYFITLIFMLLMTLIAAYSLHITYKNKTFSAHYPGKEIAQVITQKWHDTYHTPLQYVAGQRWISGNIAFYSKDHPAVFLEWNKHHAPWIDVKEMQKSGAVFVWDIAQHDTLPETILIQFPQIKQAKIIEFSWHRNRRLEPIRIGVAMLPPTWSIK